MKIKLNALAALQGMTRFHAAKRFGLPACGLAVVIWFGLFMVIGGAGFQMWQTEAGGGALSGAFSYAVMSALILVSVQQQEK